MASDKGASLRMEVFQCTFYVYSPLRLRLTLSLCRPDVPAGTYVLSVISHDHIFDKVPSPRYTLSKTHSSQLRVDVLETDTLPEIHPYIPGTPMLSPSLVALSYPIHLSATQKLNFYTAREGFNLVGMFKNPMMLMMLVGGVLVFSMPYIMVCFVSYLMPTRTLMKFAEKP